MRVLLRISPQIWKKIRNSLFNLEILSLYRIDPGKKEATKYLATFPLTQAGSDGSAWHQAG
jgi:hypothetical protein